MNIIEKEWTAFTGNWHKWSTGQGDKVVDLESVIKVTGGLKGQGHLMPNLDSKTIQTLILDPIGEVAAICVFFFTQWSKNSFFAPQGRHIALINVTFGTEQRTYVSNFTFIGAEMWEYSPQNCRFEFWP